MSGTPGTFKYIWYNNLSDIQKPQIRFGTNLSPQKWVRKFDDFRMPDEYEILRVG